VTVSIDGRTLTVEDVVAVAVGGADVALAADARARMEATRGVVERALARGDAVYGLSTAVGVLKRVGVADDAAAAAYSDRMLRHHRVSQGPRASRPVVRATLLVLANELATAHPGVRPLLVERLADALNRDDLPEVRVLGSVGQADLAQMADVALGVFRGVPLAPGEGLALIGNNAFATAVAALATARATDVLESMVVSGGLALEALAANPGMLHPAVADARPYPGLRRTLDALRQALDGSYLWSGARARNLQDPLSFRNLPQILGAVDDGLAGLRSVVETELNASQGNPIVVLGEERIVSVANYEILPLASALDAFRIVLATAIGALAERIVKLLEAPWSGLPTGLVAGEDPTDPGLGYLGIASQAIAAEARLLAAPVSMELVSTAHAEGIEDRTALAGLGARRLDEMLALATRLGATELVVAAQAVELRGSAPLGRRTAPAVEVVRSLIPFVGPDEFVPDLEPLVDRLSGARLPQP
jgi:histidine ammonia-lyase